ncbi:MAG: GDP-mannose 4,6-dehydratase [Candidatus Micrarchaeia archaeon]
MKDLKGKTAFVTGGSGLLGSFIIRRLLSLDATVYSLETNRTRLFDRLDGLKVSRVLGDINEPSAYSNEIKEADMVIDLAAMVNISQCASDPAACYRTNTLGTVSILEAMRKNCRKDAKFLYCSTTNVYGKPAYLPIDEAHPLLPSEQYGSSKAASEMICNVYHRTYGMDIVCIRPSSIYGPSQEKTQLIPKILSLSSTGGKILKSKNKICRDFVYAGDVAEAAIASCEKGKPGNAYNIASGISMDVNDIIDEILAMAKVKNPNIEMADLQPRENECSGISFSISKAKQELGWVPKTSIKTGLSETISYFEKRRDDKHGK